MTQSISGWCWTRPSCVAQSVIGWVPLHSTPTLRSAAMSISLRSASSGCDSLAPNVYVSHRRPNPPATPSLLFITSRHSGSAYARVRSSTDAFCSAEKDALTASGYGESSVKVKVSGRGVPTPSG